LRVFFQEFSRVFDPQMPFLRIPRVHLA
jgi:hypothetical protein